MIFWRKKSNSADQEREEREEKLLHRSGEPELGSEVGADPMLDPEFVAHELAESETEILDELEEIPLPAIRRFRMLVRRARLPIMRRRGAG